MQTSGPRAVQRSAVSRSTASATAPSESAAMPPRPIASPIERPRCDTDAAGQVLLAHHQAHAERPDHGRAGEEESDEPDRAAHEHVGRDQRRGNDEAAEEHLATADAVGQRAAQQGAEGSGEEKQRQHARSVGNAVAARDLVQRDEREEAHVSEAPQADDGEEHQRPTPLVCRRGGPHRDLCRRERRQARKRKEQHRGDEQAREGNEHASVEAQAERDDEERRDQRPEREPDVPPHREQRHPARTLASAHVAGELRALRVVGGDAEPREEHADDHEPVARRDRGERDPDAGERDAGGQQPERPARVRPEAERRLDDRRADRRHEDERAHHRVREVELGLQKGQQRRQRPLRQVGGQVARGEGGHAAGVEAILHARNVTRAASRQRLPNQR